MTIEQQIWQWLDDVVIGLNLCPFAKKPRSNQQIRLVLNESRKNKSLLNSFKQELKLLTETPASQTDTTLFAIPNHLYEFFDYLDFVDQAQLALEQLGYEGIFQLATFHPDYQFEDTTPECRENYTNRAPCAIVHIIREDSMAKVLEKYPNPEQIPENNITRVKGLSVEQMRSLFPFIGN